MTLDEQMTELRRMGSTRILYWARPSVVVLSVGLVLAGAFTGNLVFYGIAIAFALVAFAIWNATPHIGNAARGLKEGVKQDGDVKIRIHQWTDAELSQYESYNGMILMDNQPLWQMVFVQPQNWHPKEGRYPAELVFIRGVTWPVVLLTSDGLLYPRLKPRRVPGGQR